MRSCHMQAIVVVLMGRGLAAQLAPGLEPTCGLAVLGNAGQYQPLALQLTMSKRGTTDCSVREVRFVWLMRKEGRWIGLTHWMPGGGGRVTDELPIALTNSTECTCVVRDPSVIGWCEHYKVRAELSVNWTAASGERQTAQGVWSPWVELHIAESPGASIGVMNQERDSNGGLWQAYRVMMSVDDCAEGVFLKKKPEEAAALARWSELAQSIPQQAGSIPHVSLDDLQGRLGVWSDDLGGSVAYRCQWLQACLALNEARKAAGYVEDMTAETVGNVALAKLLQAETALSRALALAGTPRERIQVLAVQARVAEMRGRRAEASSIRTSVRNMHEWAALRTHRGIAGELANFIAKE